MKIAGIVFDKDGTLLEIPPFWFGLISHAAEAVTNDFVKENKQQTEEELIVAAGLNTDGSCIADGFVASGTNEDIAKAWTEILQKKGIILPQSFSADTRALIAGSYRYGKVLPTSGKFPLVLKKLKEKGMRLGVATSDDRIQSEYCLKQLGIAGFFDTIVTADMVPRPKPYPDMMEEIAKRWSLSTAEIMMVGDTANDMKFAAESGAVGVYYDPNEEEAPPACCAAIKDPGEVLKLIERINKKVRGNKV